MTGIALNLDFKSPESIAASSAGIEDWERITAQIASGDSESFRIYYECYFELMFRESRRLIARDEQTCLDIVQDSMIKVIGAMKPINAKPQLDAWSRSVVRSVAYDWLRKQNREQLRQAKLSDRMGTDDDSNHVENAARLLWVEDQLQNVDPDLRRMIALRYRFGWSLSRIAQKFGLKTGAVDGRIRRAVEQLKSRAGLEFNE